jgi:TonB family protein
MNKKALIPALALLTAAWASVTLQAATRLNMKLRVYEGTRQGALIPPKFVTSSYIQPTITANLRTGFELDKEKDQIKRVFNLQDVSLLTEADLIIGEGGQAPDRVRHYFRLNGSAYTIYIIWKSQGRFLVNFNEIVADEPQNVLVTEMTLIGGHSAVFGFENRQGKPYFCSFHITGPPDKIPIPPPPPPPLPPAPPELKKEIEDFEKGALKITNTMTPPRLLKLVDPVYPEAAKKEGLQGNVFLNIRTDEQGNVKRVIVIESSDGIFNEAAVQAVKQWKYEPYIQDGRPKEVVFSVSVAFSR